MEKKEEAKEFLVVDRVIECGKLNITSKTIKYSKLEIAWRVGITVAVIALICLSV